MDNNNQTPEGQKPLSPQTAKRNQMYRVAYIGIGVLALIIYYGLPAIFPITKDAADRIILLIAVPWCFYNAYVSFRWRDTLSETVTYIKNKRPWLYKLWRFESLGILSAEKPMMPYTTLMWIVLGISGLIWFFVTL